MSPAPPWPGALFVATNLAVSSLGWSASFVFMKLMAGSVDPLVIAAVRGVVAGLALAAFLALTGTSLMPRSREEAVQWLVIGTLNGFVPNILTAYALVHIGASLAAMIQASGPLVVALAAHAMFASEALTARRLAGVVIGLAGMTLLIAPAIDLSAGIGLPGVLAMTGTMLCYAAATLYVRTLARTEANRLAFGQQSVSGLAAVPIALAVLGPQGFAPALPNAWLLLGLGTVSTAIPVIFFMRVLTRAGPTAAAMNSYLMPVWATLLAVLILGETVGWREIAALLVILAGVALVTARPRAA